MITIISADRVALVNVSNPENALGKEVLLPVLQYVGLPDCTGPVYGVVRAAAKERLVEQNPVLAFGDITKTKTRMAYRRKGDVTSYEWALQAFDQYPDRHTRLMPGVQVGFDLVVCDRDKPVQTREG